MSVINTNITSMIGQSNLSKSQSALQTSMERLSSGLRINSAKDDAAGQAIANRMTAQITGLAQAQRNANDGISIAQTAEGSLNQVNDNLQRIRELTVQAQNGTNSEADLTSIQEEIDQRLAEIDRISDETAFNGVDVLASDRGLKIQVGANDGEAITVNLKEINAETLGLKDFSVSTTQIKFSDSIARKSDAAPNVTGINLNAATNVADAFGAAFGAGNAAFADDTGMAAYLTGSSATGQYLDGAGDQQVYKVNIDGGEYFVARDASGAADAINLLKQGEDGFEVVEVDGKEVQVAMKGGKTVAFVQNDDDLAQQVDLTGGVNSPKLGDVLAHNDDNLVVNVDGQNYSVYEIQTKDANGDYQASGQFAARLDDGTVLAVSVDDATGVASVKEDEDGNKAQYVLQKDGTSAAVFDVDGTLFNADLEQASGDAAIRTAEFDMDNLQTTGTTNPLKALDDALNQVDSLRSELGAVQNRFEDAITNLNTNETNLAAARSRIEDADYAVEVANMTRAQILQQAGTSVLAQANQIPQNVLSLLG